MNLEERPHRAPDLFGPAGEAWRYTAVPEGHPTLACWLVRRPDAHPAWKWWVVCALSLEDRPGLSPAKLRYSEAQVEIQILTLHPQEALPDPDSEAPRMAALVPPDFVEQYHGLTEHQVAWIVRSMVAEIVNGGESPDSDHRSCWERKVGAWVRHYREDVH